MLPAATTSHPKKGVTGAAVNWMMSSEVGIPIVAAGFVACWLIRRVRQRWAAGISSRIISRDQ